MPGNRTGTESVSVSTSVTERVGMSTNEIGLHLSGEVSGFCKGEVGFTLKHSSPKLMSSPTPDDPNIHDDSNIPDDSNGQAHRFIADT